MGGAGRQLLLTKMSKKTKFKEYERDREGERSERDQEGEREREREFGDYLKSKLRRGQKERAEVEGSLDRQGR